MNTTKHTWMISAALLAATACDPEADGIEGVTAPTGFAVTHTDYDSAGAIALLAPDGTLEQARFIHSGTVFDGLGAALSSDVVLPTFATEPGVLTYIERLGADTVTRINIAEGEVIAQIATDTDAASYRSNPYDYLHVDANTAWVTRNAPNTDVATTDINAGTDLITLDLATGELGTDRIDLSAMNTTGTVTNIDTNEETEVVVYARPARVVRVGEHAVVGLDRISLAYDFIGPGMIAIADLTEKTAEPLALEGLSNCGSVIPVEGDSTRVVVACVGTFLGDPRAEAGIALVRVNNGVATIEHTWSANDNASDPIAVSNVVSLGGTRVIAIAPGDFGATTDRAFVLDLATGEMDLVVESEDSYVLGAGAYSAETRTLLLPDASADEDGVVTGGLRRFQWDAAGEVTELDLVETDSDLPPRTVSALR